MQNPSDFTTRATRKTTRFGVRDAKCKRRTAPCTEPAWALQNSKAIGQMCKKPWENQDSRKLKVERSCGQDRNRTTYKFPGKLALRHHARHEIRRAPISLFETTRNTIHRDDTDRFQFGSSTCPPPANGGFRMDSGQRGSRSR